MSPRGITNQLIENLPPDDVEELITLGIARFCEQQTKNYEKIRSVNNLLAKLIGLRSDGEEIYKKVLQKCAPELDGIGYNKKR